MVGAIKNRHCGGKQVAGCKGLEPSTFCVTGRRSKPAELTPRKAHISYNAKCPNASVFLYGLKNRPNGRSFYYLISFPIATAVSHMRFEKPHSLSYHAVTCTNLSPSTFVCAASKMELCASPVKSTETNGLSL